MNNKCINQYNVRHREADVYVPCYTQTPCTSCGRYKEPEPPQMTYQVIITNPSAAPVPGDYEASITWENRDGVLTQVVTIVSKKTT